MCTHTGAVHPHSIRWRDSEGQVQDQNHRSLLLQSKKGERSALFAGVLYCIICMARHTAMAECLQTLFYEAVAVVFTRSLATYQSVPPKGLHHWRHTSSARILNLIILVLQHGIRMEENLRAPGVAAPFHHDGGTGRERISSTCSSGRRLLLVRPNFAHKMPADFSLV